MALKRPPVPVWDGPGWSGMVRTPAIMTRYESGIGYIDQIYQIQQQQLPGITSNMDILVRYDIHNVITLGEYVMKHRGWRERGGTFRGGREMESKGNVGGRKKANGGKNKREEEGR